MSRRTSATSPKRMEAPDGVRKGIALISARFSNGPPTRIGIEKEDVSKLPPFSMAFC